MGVGWVMSRRGAISVDAEGPPRGCRGDGRVVEGGIAAEGPWWGDGAGIHRIWAECASVGAGQDVAAGTSSHAGLTRDSPTL